MKQATRQLNLTSGGLEISATLREANPGDVGDIIKLQDSVIASLPDKNLFHPDDEDFYMQVTSCDSNFSQVIYTNNEIIAFSLLIVPGKDDPDNLGIDIGLSSNFLDEVCHLEMVMVSSHFRGNGLQYLFVKERIAYAQENGFQYILATVDPNNKVSLKNLQKAGMQIELENVEKYGGKVRHILKYK